MGRKSLWLKITILMRLSMRYVWKKILSQIDKVRHPLHIPSFVLEKS